MNDHNQRECAGRLLPIRDALDILNGKWKIPIIVALMFGNKRFKLLLRNIDGITAKMLSKELKDLELNQLVTRTVYDSTPVAVEYSLTEYGKSLQPVIMSLHDWGQKHRRRILSTKKKAELVL